MMDVLMYLFETHVYEETELVVDPDVLEDELARAGFKKLEVEKALEWLKALADLRDNNSDLYLSLKSARIRKLPLSVSEFSSFGKEGPAYNKPLKNQNL